MICLLHPRSILCGECPGVSWTSKQLVSLTAALGVQLALFMPLFEMAFDASGMPRAGTAVRIVHLLPVGITNLQQPAPHSAAPFSHEIQNHVTEDLMARDADPATALPDPSVQRRAEYLPASQLTERPQVLIDIDPELSDRFKFIPPQSLDLALLISEYGDVDRVLILPPTETMAGPLPALLLKERVQQFLAARFLPGRLYGQPVRSALKIRVSLGP